LDADVRQRASSTSTVERRMKPYLARTRRSVTAYSAVHRKSKPRKRPMSALMTINTSTDTSRSAHTGNLSLFGPVAYVVDTHQIATVAENSANSGRPIAPQRDGRPR